MSVPESFKHNTSIISPYRLSLEQRAKLNDEDDFSDFPLKGPPTSNVVHLTSKDLDPTSNKFVEGAAPGLISLRFSTDEAKAAKSFDFTPFALDQFFRVYEPSHAAEQGDYIETLTKKPPEAKWREGTDGRRHCLFADGREVKETKIVYLIVDRRIIAFTAYSRALKPINDMIDRAGRLSGKYPFETDGKVEIKHFHGPLISKWNMTTLEHRQGAYRWWTPHPMFLGKLGEKNGPSIDEYFFTKQVRENFREGVLLWNEPTAQTPALKASSASPTLPRRRSVAGESGKDELSEEPPPSAPLPDRYDGPDDDIPF